MVELYNWSLYLHGLSETAVPKSTCPKAGPTITKTSTVTTTTTKAAKTITEPGTTETVTSTTTKTVTTTTNGGGGGSVETCVVGSNDIENGSFEEGFGPWEISPGSEHPGYLNSSVVKGPETPKDGGYYLNTNLGYPGTTSIPSSVLFIQTGVKVAPDSKYLLQAWGESNTDECQLKICVNDVNCGVTFLGNTWTPVTAEFVSGTEEPDLTVVLRLLVTCAGVPEGGSDFVNIDAVSFLCKASPYT